VRWSDGTLLDYDQFRSVLDDPVMYAELRDVWKQRWDVPCPKRTRFGGDGVCGAMTFVPTLIGDEAHAIVHLHFLKALVKIAKKPSPARSKRPDHHVEAGWRVTGEPDDEAEIAHMTPAPVPGPLGAAKQRGLSCHYSNADTCLVLLTPNQPG
jgi:hypothetical protein